MIIKDRILNIIIRVSTLATRFVFIFILAKLASIEVIGTYGLILATISFAVMLIGADFYVFSQREMLQREKKEWAWVLTQQMYTQLGLYLLLLPFGLLLFYFEIISWELLAVFYLLLISEHIAQELNRILVSLDEQIQASLILFIRKSLWMFPVLYSIYIDNTKANIEFILWNWTVGCLISILIGIYFVNKKINTFSIVSVDWIWIKKGLVLSLFFLIATLCLKGLTTFDKYTIELLGDKELLGVYVLYMTIVFGAYSFLDFAVYSFLYPTLLKTYKKDMHLFNKTFKEFIYSTILIGFFLGVFIYFFTPLLLHYIEKEKYIEYLNILNIIILAGYISNLEYIPHYYLYSAKADKWIIYSKVIALLLFFIFILIMSSFPILERVSYALLFSYLSILIIKIFGYFKIKSKDKNFV